MTSLPNISTEWQRFDQLSPAALYELLRFRQQIFVVEQRSPYPDLDGLDHSAWHLSLRVEGVLAGCLRLLPPTEGPPLVRIGRVAVAPERRRQGLGRKLMAEGLSFCREHYPGRGIVLGAQLHLVSFYESLGFTATTAPYDDFGVAHVEMAISGEDNRSA
ncbi:MAG TPA: GNAT family N-acetyltransferase [Stellaceae bacterium]|nr:GNAT family N-acetyltransferase [Stellaceae bacterium]